MEVRDPQVVRRFAAGPFPGYARHGSGIERIVACVLLLVTMVGSGILLGSSEQR